MTCILGFDLAPSLSGYCVGDGQGAPVAAAWEFPDCGDDLGALGEHMAQQARALIAEHQPDLVTYEAPILRQTDKLWKLRRIYGLGMALEMTCRAADVPCLEIDLRRIKGVLTGDAFAEKTEVVRAVMRLGVPLPRTDAEGRKDAADAFGCWLIGMMEIDHAAASPWLARIGGCLL